MTIKDVSKLAELARIELSEAEKESVLSDMKGILEYVKIIESVEVEDIKPEHRLYNVWREDMSVKEVEVSNKDFSHKLLVDQFPGAQDGFLKVKKIL